MPFTLKDFCNAYPDCPDPGSDPPRIYADHLHGDGLCKFLVRELFEDEETANCTEEQQNRVQNAITELEGVLEAITDKIEEEDNVATT